MQKDIAGILEEVTKVVKGKDRIVLQVVAAILGGGHILLEDIPGVGKTTLAVTLSRTMNLVYHRTQFTPDVLPSDITGFSMYNAKTGEFEYREGAAICNLFLADEINRTSPKTQSALLEVMEEAKVTVDGTTHVIPQPFIVIATQNPIGSSGTQRMPESQMDRFLVRLRMGYPSADAEVEILRGNGAASIDQVRQVIDREELVSMREAVTNVFLSDEVYRYIVDLTNATRNSEKITLGLSPRGSLATMKMAKANAFIQERDYVTVQDVLEHFHEIAEHRLTLSPRARAAGMDVNDVLEEVITSVKAPKV